MTQRIFLLEDDVQLNATVKQFLTLRGYEVITAFDAEGARDRLYETPVDLMLLDVKVPGQNGIELLADLRREGQGAPAIFITSLSGADDVERGFAAGGDDYIRKPFALKELAVRIEALLRRTYGSRESKIDLGGGLTFDTESLLLMRDNQTVPLKTKELKLLALFLKNVNELLPYARIYQALWEWDEEPNPASLRTYVNTLRSEIGRERIETIKNTGYRFVEQ
jgi:DNA-binding response OmpR family regulator